MYHVNMQIASWVAQASFEPLGLTVAVAKDRAIESLMQVRNYLSCVGSSAKTLCNHCFCKGRVHSEKFSKSSNAVTAVTPQSMRNADVEMSWCLAALQVGDPFVLNCLGEAKYGVLMKVSCLKQVFWDLHRDVSSRGYPCCSCPGLPVPRLLCHDSPGGGLASWV